MIKIIIVTFAFSAWAGPAMEATEEIKSAVGRMTSGDIVELELARNGLNLLEAEGDIGQKISSFKPNDDLKNVNEISDALKDYPNFKAEEWSLEKGRGDKWVYEVSGTENGREREFELDARTMALLSDSRD